MAHILEQLQQIHSKSTDVVDQFNKREIDKQLAMTGLQNLQQQVEGMNDDLITEFSDLPTDQSTKAIAYYYKVKGEIMSSMAKVNPSNATAGTAIDSSLAPPRISKNASSDLTTNVQKLRTSLQNIKRAITETQNQNELTFNDIQDKSTTKEISVMAIEQIRQTTKVQNKQLTAENQQLKAQVQQLSEENQVLKQKFTEANISNEQAEGQAGAFQTLNTQLKEHIAAITEELESVQRDRDNYKTKFDNLFQQSTMISQQNASERASSVKNLMRLEAENAALQDMNKKLRDRVSELEQCDVESAAIEVHRAEQTVAQLNQVIEDLKGRLSQQKQHYTEIIEDHKTTIAALQEELFGNDDEPDRLSRAELESRLAQINNENMQLKSQVVTNTGVAPRTQQSTYGNQDFNLDQLLSMVSKKQ